VPRRWANSALINEALAPVQIRVVAASLVTFMGDKMHLIAVGAWVVGMRP
jgi:hypothetical protein